VTLILDAGALIAAERSDRTIVALLKAERRAGGVPVTQRGAVVWRFEGDKIRRMETYLRRELALAAAGLEQPSERGTAARGL